MPWQIRFTLLSVVSGLASAILFLAPSVVSQAAELSGTAPLAVIDGEVLLLLC